ncbi:uncharacterized protein [Nicotiana tomentosiformis]|uniref:uncharacterized protein n=1 Tax=Nicotiana tomentosiformis TaxID=4098 RepID=UPI00388CEA56
MALFEALYGRRCRSPIGWFEAELLGPDLVHQAMEKVKIMKKWLKTDQSHQKSYSETRRRDLKVKEDDWVFLKVSPMKGIMPFEISLVHPVFHVSMLKKVVGDPSLIVPVQAIEVNEELTYEAIPVAILDRQVRKLRNKEIASVKLMLRVFLFGNILLVRPRLALFLCYVASLVHVYVVRVGFGDSLTGG